MRRLVISLAILAALAPAVAQASYPATFEPVPRNPADALAHLRLEPFGYDKATRCVKRPTAGAIALQGWLTRNVKGSSWGINRCEIWSRPPRKKSASLHAEGRAVDWHLDAASAADKREAKRLISLLLAPDVKGRPAALARRMGVQEIIWDCRAWFGGEPELRRYSACKKGVDRTTAHRDHIHLGLTKDGAKKRTSFWTRKQPLVSEDDEPGWGEEEELVEEEEVLDEPVEEEPEEG